MQKINRITSDFFRNGPEKGIHRIWHCDVSRHVFSIVSIPIQEKSYYTNDAPVQAPSHRPVPSLPRPHQYLRHRRLARYRHAVDPFPVPAELSREQFSSFYKRPVLYSGGYTQREECDCIGGGFQLPHPVCYLQFFSFVLHTRQNPEHG